MPGGLGKVWSETETYVGKVWENTSVGSVCCIFRLSCLDYSSWKL